jgi:excisionase family DNA binding protein
MEAYMSYTIPEWCQRHHFSRAYFYEMAKRGTAPATFWEGRSRRISERADEAWVHERERAAELKRDRGRR